MSGTCKPPLRKSDIFLGGLLKCPTGAVKKLVKSVILMFPVPAGIGKDNRAPAEGSDFVVIVFELLTPPITNV